MGGGWTKGRWTPLTALWLVLLAPLPAQAEPQAKKVGEVTALVGEATVAHANIGAPVPVRVPDGVFFQDRFDTQAQSGVRLLLGGKAVLTIRELSSVTIMEQPRRAIVDLSFGQTALRLLRSLVASGETVEVRTPNAIAAVRGSLLIAEIGGSADDPQTAFKALEAHVPILVSSRADPTRTVPLSPNQAVNIAGKGMAARISPVRVMPPGEVRREKRFAEAFHRRDLARGAPGRGRAHALAKKGGGRHVEGPARPRERKHAQRDRAPHLR